MASKDTLIFEGLLRADIKLQEEKLKLRLEGGDLNNVRLDDFLTSDYKGEELVTPPGGIYNAQKELEEWMNANRPAPGEDQDKIKKKMWRQFSKELSSEISKNIVDWLNKDVIPNLAVTINNQILDLEFDLTVPIGGIIVAGSAVTQNNTTPITLSGVQTSDAATSTLEIKTEII